jgi:transposase InsO family protein
VPLDEAWPAALTRWFGKPAAAREIREYIDLFYNRQRRQARLGYLSPATYTQQFMRQQQAA